MPKPHLAAQKRRAKRDTARSLRRNRPRQPRFLRIFLHGDLDLIAFEAETRQQLKQFQDVRVPRYGPRLRVFVDMAGVTDIDACALLHMVAQVDRLGGLGVEVLGNTPNASAARAILEEAKFIEFMATPRQGRGRAAAEGPSLKISFDRAVKKLSPTAWLPLYDFIKSQGQHTEDEVDVLYNAFGECVENVRQHAYGATRQGKWFALAMRPNERRAARVVVLDLGVGIPASIRREPIDNSNRLLAMLFAEIVTQIALDAEEKSFAKELRSEDWPCIFWATLGLRTQSKKPGGGTGLTGLRQAILELGRGAMHVFSGRASVAWKQGTGPKMRTFDRLQGTAVCLELGVRS